VPRFHVQHEQAVVALLRCTHNELWCAHMQSLRNRPKAADMDHWLATGQLLLDGGVLVTANVYLSAPGSPRPDWGCRVPTSDPSVPFIHVQGQSKKAAATSRFGFHNSYFFQIIINQYQQPR
jgi:hypothetical protein